MLLNVPHDSDMSGLASFVNHSDNLDELNAVLVYIGNRVFRYTRSETPLKQGQQLFINYGSGSIKRDHPKIARHTPTDLSNRVYKKIKE